MSGVPVPMWHSFEMGSRNSGLKEVIGEFPIFIPSVAVTSIGAGGGSIAWVDDLDILRVVPRVPDPNPVPRAMETEGNAQRLPMPLLCWVTSASLIWLQRY